MINGKDLEVLIALYSGKLAVTIDNNISEDWTIQFEPGQSIFIERTTRSDDMICPEEDEHTYGIIWTSPLLNHESTFYVSDNEELPLTIVASDLFTEYWSERYSLKETDTYLSWLEKKLLEARK